MPRRSTTECGTEGADADTVLAADDDGAYEGTKYLFGLGHRRIGLVVGRSDTTSGRERRTGYLRALHDAAVEADPALVREGPYTPAFGADAVDELLRLPESRRPTAIFLANHEAVFGAIPGLYARGIRVPEDLSLLCYEDVAWFSWWSPPITVLDHGPAEIGELAAELLSKHMSQARGHDGSAAADEATGREFRVGTRLIVRRSCSSPPG